MMTEVVIVDLAAAAEVVMEVIVVVVDMEIGIVEAIVAVEVVGTREEAEVVAGVFFCIIRLRCCGVYNILRKKPEFSKTWWANELCREEIIQHLEHSYSIVSEGKFELNPELYRPFPSLSLT